MTINFRWFNFFPFVVDSNLSLADLLLLTICVPYAIVVLFHDETWTPGQRMCKDSQ